MMQQKVNKGFTLVETAIVLAIVGALMAGGMSLLSTSSDVGRYKDSQYQLEEAKEALINYYLQFGQLPCPDSVAPFDGKAEATCTTGSALRGYLPYNTLGIAGNGDAWSQPIKYVVNPKFTTTTLSNPSDASSPKIALLCSKEEASGIKEDGTLNSSKGLRVINPTSDAIVINNLQTTPSALAENLAFALLSTGKNGAQTNAGMTNAFSGNGGCTQLSSLEQENCNDNSTLRSGDPMVDAHSVTFDDLLVWMSDVQLLGLLQKSGNCYVNIPPPEVTPPSAPSSPSDPTPPPSKPKKGCSAGADGQDAGLLLLLFVALLGAWLRFRNR